MGLGVHFSEVLKSFYIYYNFRKDSWVSESILKMLGEVYNTKGLRPQFDAWNVTAKSWTLRTYQLKPPPLPTLGQGGGMWGIFMVFEDMVRP